MPANSSAMPKVNQVTIKVDGTDIDHKYMDKVVLVEVDTSLNLPGMAIIRFHDDELDIVDNGPFATGKALQIEFPDLSSNALARVFAGEITSIDLELTQNFTATYTIRGYDRSHRLSRGRNTRAFVNVTDSDVVTQLVGSAGLSATVDSTSTVYPHLIQHNQTDLAFIHERARRIGFEVLVDDRTLYFRKPEGDRGQVTLTWGVNLRSFKPHLSLVGQVNEVIVKGWDPQNKQAITGRAATTATHPVTGFNGPGGSLAQSAFQSAAKQVTVHRPVTTQGDADKMAQAILDEINSGFLEAEGTCYGNAAILAGKKIQVQKVGTKFGGTYLVTTAIHRYTLVEGYDTIFTVEGRRPEHVADLIDGASEPQYAAGTWYGVVTALVTNNSDPQNQGRVKLKYPWLDENLETDWVRVMAIGAGNTRGIEWLPEVNDEVLVAFQHGDFNYPFVIGGLWNGRDAAPLTSSDAIASGNVKQRVFKSRLGHKVTFMESDSDEYIEIVDSQSKNKIKLDAKNNKLEITCQGPVTIDAQDKVEVKTTKDVSMTATGNIEIKATQNLTLKGMQVNIN